MISKKRFIEKMAAQKLAIEPFNRGNLSEVGVDLTIGEVYQLELAENRILDLKKPPKYSKNILTSRGLTLKPGEIYTIATAERISTHQTCGLVTPVQNVVRSGMHLTSGMVDYGYSGPIFLTVSVERDTKVYPGISIAHFSLFDSTISIKERYNGHFQNGQLNMKEIGDGQGND